MHILHLEDDGPLREILKVALETAEPKLHITQFINSDDALEYIIGNLDTITLFVLDIRVPGQVDGIGVAEKIRNLGFSGPIVLTSAYRKPDQHRIRDLNCLWMSKPWHILNAAQTIIPMAMGKPALN